MDWRVMALALFLYNLFLFSCYGIEGYDASLTQENEKLEEELKRLNKPAIKTIYTKHGDVYDCVDFYKQPSLDHPLLKNHNFHPEMKPRTIPKSLTPDNVQSHKYKSMKLGLEDGGCPFGTVPIRRTTKDDLLRAKLHSKMFTPNEQAGTHHAAIQQPTPNQGGGGEINIYNLPVTGLQYTSGQLKVINGDEFLVAGWTVNPGVYGDNRTHMFAFLNADGRSCFNTQCGFVQVSQEVPVNTVMEPVSTYGGDQYLETFFIIQEPTNSNWYLKITPGQELVGYWPSNFLTKWAGGATAVEWGGETYSPPGIPPPRMGAGHDVDFNTKKTGFARHCKLLIDNNIVDPPLSASASKKVIDGWYYVYDVGTTDRDGRIIIYGGPGVKEGANI